MLMFMPPRSSTSSTTPSATCSGHQPCWSVAPSFFGLYDRLLISWMITVIKFNDYIQPLDYYSAQTLIRDKYSTVCWFSKILWNHLFVVVLICHPVYVFFIAYHIICPFALDTQMPHESTVAHEQRFQVGDGPVSTRSRASSIQAETPDKVQTKRPKIRVCSQCGDGVQGIFWVVPFQE